MVNDIKGCFDTTNEQMTIARYIEFNGKMKDVSFDDLWLETTATVPVT